MEAVVRFGKDTWVGAGKASANHNDANRLRLKSGASYAFVHVKNPVPAGLTVVEATYTVYAAKAADWVGTKTLKLRKTAERVPFGRMTWDNQPGVKGSVQPSATVTDAAHGQAISFDVTQHIQNTAGEPWYGWRIESDSATAHRVFGYESDYAPVLEVTYALSPSQPVDLSPSGGAVSVQFPTFTFDAVDLDNPSDMVALQIQIDPAGDFAAPAFDTNEVAASTPVWDSTGSAWAGIANGASVQWRARYKSGEGVWGDWSDPATFSRVAKSTLTITNPAEAPSNFVAEATPPILWTFAGTQEAWRVRILDAADPTVVVADSRKQDGADDSWTLPRKTIRDGESYLVQVRVWDGVDRVATSGDPAFTVASRQFSFQHDPTVDAPVMVGAEQVDDTPMVRVTFTRATAPDSWTLLVDGQPAETDIDPADTLTTGTTHELLYVAATPQQAHTYEVRAVVNGKASPKSAPAALATFPEGVWLLDYDRDLQVQMAEVGIDNWRRTDQVGVYYPLGGIRPVQIVTGNNGIGGSFTGTLTDSDSRTTAQWRADFDKIAARPTRTYQLVTANLSIPVKIRNASATPHPDTLPHNLMDRVYFEFFEDIT